MSLFSEREERGAGGEAELRHLRFNELPQVPKVIFRFGVILF